MTTKTDTEQEIYGWHIIHAPTGLPYAFCAREVGGTVLTEDDVLDGLDPELFVLVPLVRAGRLQ